MSRKAIIWSVAGFFATTLFIWLFLQDITLFVAFHSPFPRPWMAVHLTSGDVMYGHVAGTARGMTKLQDAYFIEKYTPAQAQSGNFNIDDVAKFVLTQRANPLYINRENILYWERVDPASEVGRYLK